MNINSKFEYLPSGERSSLQIFMLLLNQLPANVWSFTAYIKEKKTCVPVRPAAIDNLAATVEL